MKSPLKPAVFFLAILALLAGIAFLYDLGGHSQESCWSESALHNWDQYGIGTLKGKIVVNPGGFEVLDKPEIYQGHRASSLYPVYFFVHFFSWTGDGLVVFQLVFSLVLFVSVGRLLGKTETAWVVAAATVLCPGYTLYPAQGDPNSIALYMALPFATLLLPLLAKSSLSAGAVAMLAILTLAYTSLNWTIAFGQGMIIACLFAARIISKRRLALYMALAGAGVLLVAGASVADKLRAVPGTGENRGVMDLLGGYAWGTGGYGVGLTTGKAIVRIAFANLLGLLPLVLSCGYFAVRRWKVDGAFPWRALLPLGTAILGVASLRNYFGHHPWMAAPMLIPGMVLTLHLLLRAKAQGQDPSRAPSRAVRGQGMKGMALLLGCFFYALVIVGADRAYHAEMYELTGLVLAHTTRSDTLVLAESLSSSMAVQTKSISVRTDRRVIVVPDLTAQTDVKDRLILISPVKLAGSLPLIATSTQPAIMKWAFVRELFDWYARRIARRNPQDHHFDYTTGGQFYLYQFTTEKP